MSFRDIEYPSFGGIGSKRLPTALGCSLSSTAFRVEIYPKETHGQLLHLVQSGHLTSCFLGLSSDTSFANKGRLTAILQWLLPKVSHLMIVEGSFLTRWNLRALDNLSECEAERIAEERHKKSATRIARITNETRGTNSSIEILDWPSVVRSTEFLKILKQVESYSAQMPNFRCEVDRVVDEYMNRLHSRCEIACLPPKRLKLLRSYVVEEVAMFVYLYFAGFHTEVYPGDDLQIMRVLASGGFTHFPFNLSERTHVSIRLFPFKIRESTTEDEAVVRDLISAWPTHFVKAAESLVMNDFRRGKTFICEDQGSPLGFLIWTENQADIELLWLATHPTAIRKGIGRTLVAAVEARATSQRRFFLKTASTDSVIPGTTFDGPSYRGTHDFFTKLGYKPFELIPNGWGKGNHCLIMEKKRPKKLWTTKP